MKKLIRYKFFKCMKIGEKRNENLSVLEREHE